MLSVWRGLARGQTPRVWVQIVSVCRFKTLPCAPAKRAHVFNMRAFCRHTRKRFEPDTRRRFEPTHGEEGGRWGGSLLSLSRPFSLSLFLLLSLFRRSLHSFSFSFSSLPLLSSLSVTMTMITRPVGSLCVHTALTCQSVRVHRLWPIPYWPNMFASCKKQLSWKNCASLVPLGMEWACICAGNECCVWLCQYVSVCVSMSQYVSVCVVFVVLLVASVLASMRWLLCGGDGSKQKEKKTKSASPKKYPAREFYLHYGLN